MTDNRVFWKKGRQREAACSFVTFDPHHSVLFVLVSHLKLLDDLCDILWSDIGHLHTKEEETLKKVTISHFCSHVWAVIWAMLSESPRWETICKELGVRYDGKLAKRLQ